ncbi:MAG: CsgG/HfaB family protein [Acidobacteriia bacterium]|nr:CsgG/HfaB family protein [Terriglobia bacterium]
MRKNLVAGLLVILMATPAFAAGKKRVAVLNFDYGTVMSSVQAIFGGNQDVGKGISDMLVEQLVNGGAYSVIERKAIDKIVAEQNFSNSDRADANTAAKIGRLLGVDAIIMGSITKFGRDDKKQNIGGAAIGGITGRFGLGGVGLRESKAVVSISARLVSVNTGEILVAATGDGQSKRSGKSLLGAGGSSGGAGGGNYDMSSSNFGDTILGEATKEAVASVATQLNGDAGKLPTAVVKINGLVADVSGNTLILNVGSKSGVQVGDHYGIYRKIRDIRDPATKKIIKSVVNKVGEVAITDVDETSCTGTYAGSGAPKVGDEVRN